MTKVINKATCFDDMLQINIAEFEGTTPLNLSMWMAILKDLAVSLYEWRGAQLSFYDLMLIEEYIYNKCNFALVHTKYKINNAIVYSGYHIFKVQIIKEGLRKQPEKIRIMLDKSTDNLVLDYDIDDFVFFDNFTQSSPSALSKKYADVLSKLDALYMQNVDKLGMPIVGVVNKSLKNEFMNLFKRAKINALYAFMQEGRDVNNKIADKFFNPQIDFILDKINFERQSIMKEFIREMGVNPSGEMSLHGQYTNNASIAESSLISKYFGAVLNKYRNNFVNKVKEKFNIDLKYETVVKSYFETERGSENGQENIDNIADNAINSDTI